MQLAAGRSAAATERNRDVSMTPGCGGRGQWQQPPPPQQQQQQQQQRRRRPVA